MFQIGHTPDADDAFMFYYLAEKERNENIELVLEDIEKLNKKVISGSIDCSAVSFYTYFKVSYYYELLSVGACFGENYGPVVVKKAEEQLHPSGIKNTVAVPGENTTAYLMLKIYNKSFKTKNYPFEKISEAVINEEVEYGVLIHEMQQTYERFGLKKVIDLGEFWFELTKLPLPLGCIIIRKGLPASIKSAIKSLIKNSLLYAITHKNEALEYAMKFARFTDRQQTEEFINKYVNKFSLDINGKYKKAIEVLGEYAFNNKLIETKPEIKIT